MQFINNTNLSHIAVTIFKPSLKFSLDIATTKQSPKYGYIVQPFKHTVSRLQLVQCILRTLLVWLPAKAVAQYIEILILHI